MKPYKITAEQMSEIEAAADALQSLCQKYDVPMLAAIQASDDGKIGTRMNVRNLPQNKSPLIFHAVSHMLFNGPFREEPPMSVEELRDLNFDISNIVKATLYERSVLSLSPSHDTTVSSHNSMDISNVIPMPRRDH